MFYNILLYVNQFGLSLMFNEPASKARVCEHYFIGLFWSLLDFAWVYYRCMGFHLPCWSLLDLLGNAEPGINKFGFRSASSTIWIPAIISMRPTLNTHTVLSNDIKPELLNDVWPYRRRSGALALRAAVVRASEGRSDGGAGAGDAGWRGAATGTWASAQGSASIHQ